MLLAQTKSMKLGLLGGSFDPVHLGHLLVAQAAREELGLERVFFIPAARSPFKASAEPAPAPERLRMLRLALAGEIHCEVDDQEIRRGGISYSIETIRHYGQAYPGAQLFYLIGADQAPHLPLWREAAELARLVEFVVVPRPGELPAQPPAPFRGRALRGFPLSASSSQIRQRIKEGLPIGHLTGAAVAEAIRNNRLYL
jgi:nicotinate-nucleotide adenylyltransferase